MTLIETYLPVEGLEAVLEAVPMTEVASVIVNDVDLRREQGPASALLLGAQGLIGLERALRLRIWVEEAAARRLRGLLTQLTPGPVAYEAVASFDLLLVGEDT